MKKFWNSDKIVSTSAIVIGVGSLIVVTYQTNLIRNQTELIQREQRTSVMPYLRMGGRTVRPDWAEAYLVNSGLGPALVKQVNIRTGGEIYSVDIVDFFKENYKYNGFLVLDAIEVGSLISAGSNITMIGANPKDSVFAKFANQFDEGEVVFEITYESLYGERWLLSSDKNIPVRLEGID